MGKSLMKQKMFLISYKPRTSFSGPQYNLLVMTGLEFEKHAKLGFTHTSEQIK